MLISRVQTLPDLAGRFRMWAHLSEVWLVRGLLTFALATASARAGEPGTRDEGVASTSLATVTARAGEPFIKGVTVSAQTWGKEWATPQMCATLDELKALGANAIAIHPYARIAANGNLSFDENPKLDYVSTPLRWAHERGLQVMLIPHIAYWGSPFLWRGEINFPEAAGWDRFFTDYERWIVKMARLAEENHAEIFCIGLEYGPSQKFLERWRKIIAAIRAVYHGRITYGANWDEIENVPFWDDLDFIGVLAYFPLTSAPNPTPVQLAAGWEKWMEKLGALSKQHGKPVLFTEIGYNKSERCAAEPWDFHHEAGPAAEEMQARCIEQALLLHDRYRFLAGMFFWKWFPDLPSPQIETFDLRTPRLKALLAKHWASTGGLASGHPERSEAKSREPVELQEPSDPR